MPYHAAEEKGIEIGMLQGHMTHKPLQGILGAQAKNSKLGKIL